MCCTAVKVVPKEGDTVDRSKYYQVKGWRDGFGGWVGGWGLGHGVEVELWRSGVLEVVGFLGGG